MLRFKRKTAFVPFALACAMVLAGFTSCGKGSGTGLSDGVSGELTIMMWSGDNKYWQDIGNLDLSPEDLTAMNVASAYATAKEFKKRYPNVKINFFSKSGAPDDENGSWEQHRDNFRMEYGVYPDIYATSDIIADIQRGLIADLSIFQNDSMYKSFNPSVMAMMSIDGRQFGLPQYLLPWGVYVNKSLADANNIDVPDPDWSIAEFTRFVNHSSPDAYYGTFGSWGDDLALVDTGTQDFAYMLLNRKPGEPFVNLNSEATRSMLRYFIQWRPNSVWANYDLGRASQEFMDQNGWWGYKFFVEGKLLTLTGDPWMMGDAAHPDPKNANSVKVADWDIYPRPSTDYMDNTVGIVLDPMVIRNYAMDDGNPELSDDERAKLEIAWEFAKFWCGDTGVWEARANQMYLAEETLKSCLNDSLPMVIGPEFDRQMEIWYTTEAHQRYKDPNKMPGFHYVLELWEKGQFWDISSKAYPWYYDFEGTRRPIAYEWVNAYDYSIVGAASTDPNWLDQVYARLPQWNTVMNQRWEAEMQGLEGSLNRYYPKQ